MYIYFVSTQDIVSNIAETRERPPGVVLLLIAQIQYHKQHRIIDEAKEHFRYTIKQSNQAISLQSPNTLTFQ